MAETHVISALVDKRARLLGEIENRRFQIIRLEIELGHLDAAIKMFKPGYDVASILPKCSFGKNPAGVPKGAGGRYALSVLRETNRPLTAGEIAERVLIRLGKPITPGARKMLAAAIFGTLSRRKDGAVMYDASTHPGTWRLAMKPL
ncbi:MAG: hypothetical protein Tsb0016_23130 [Sphingomonadales bacterium]